MQVSSLTKPLAYTIERNGLYCTVTIYANITENTKSIEGKNTTVYTYDKYTLMERYRANLEVDIKTNFDTWAINGRDTEKDTESQKVRNYRDSLLNACDLQHCNPEKWTAMSDSEKLAWATYKQSLRDITTQKDFPYAVIWPALPSDTTNTLSSALTATQIEGEQITALSLSDAEKNTLLSQLGTQAVQMRLDIAGLKGGAAS